MLIDDSSKNTPRWVIGENQHEPFPGYSQFKQQQQQLQQDEREDDVCGKDYGVSEVGSLLCLGNSSCSPSKAKTKRAPEHAFLEETKRCLEKSNKEVCLSRSASSCELKANNHF